jgi:hypothetical protein
MYKLITQKEVQKRFEAVIGRGAFINWLNEKLLEPETLLAQELVLQIDQYGDLIWDNNEDYRPESLYIEKELVGNGFDVVRTQTKLTMSGWA